MDKRLHLILTPNTYARRILRLAPLAYWPLDDVAGTVARELARGWHGTYTNGPLLANAAGPDGKPAPWFDGNNQMVNIGSAALLAALTGSAATLFAWSKVNGAANWSDATTRGVIGFYESASNRVFLTKSTTANRYIGRYDAATSLSKYVNVDGLSLTTWFCSAITWSAATGECRVFLNGTQQGDALTGIAAWAAAMTSGAIGSTNGSQYFWHGWLAHAAIWNRALSPAEIAAISVI